MYFLVPIWESAQLQRKRKRKSEVREVSGLVAVSPARSHSSVSVALDKASSSSGSRVVTSSWRVSIGLCFGTKTLPVGKREKGERGMRGETDGGKSWSVSREVTHSFTSVKRAKHNDFYNCNNSWRCDATVRDSITRLEAIGHVYKVSNIVRDEPIQAEDCSARPTSSNSEFLFICCFHVEKLWNCIDHGN